MSANYTPKPEMLGLIPGGGFLEAIRPFLAQTGSVHPALDDDEDDDEGELTVLELFKTSYRSVLPDGSVWCQSDDPDDMLRRGPADGRPLTYQQLRVVFATTGWTPYKPQADHPFNLITVQELDGATEPEVPV